ncbi:MobF family relaxase [Nocardiopsis tropica]|uniref:MobF family relaxase n=1 Tax=Nocardiopsis tropica TaxID=109330 RepID=A0ABU7KS18_9ACTN|nr:MobF family relaxase [Nocardiopsis umidischolae]MEE2051794.1 MobF family relaxase [Nocardiopsis umidischolae]
MLSMTPGYDPGYLTRASAEPKNYYLAAISQHGEPPGRWWGPGAAALGFAPGAVIDPRVMEQLYSTFNDPTSADFFKDDCADRLGRRPPRFRDAESWYEKSLNDEPEATAERREELWAEAVQRAERQSTVYFYDATFSPVKSVSLLHAGLQAAAHTAEARSQHDLAQQYRNAAEAVWEGVREGSAASLEYLVEHAGDARVGYHGGTVEGRSTGRWDDAGGFVVARFEQHTNREGEPALHVHQAILNRQMCADGKWRGVDSRALFRSRAGAAAVGERTMMENLTRVLGVEWVQRADGNGWEIKGVEPEQIAAFSTRRARITAELDRLLSEYERNHGHQPSARALFKISQHVTTSSRPSKEQGRLSRAAMLKQWEDKLNREEVSNLIKIPARALGLWSPDRVPTPVTEEFEATPAMVERIITTAVARIQQSKSTFSRHDVLRRINDELPGYLGILPGAHLDRLLNELTDQALDPSGPTGVRLLNAPDVVTVPGELRRADGTSAYLAPNAERYTTLDELDLQQRLTSEALREGAPRTWFEHEPIAHGLVFSPVQLTAPELLGGFVVARQMLASPLPEAEHQPLADAVWLDEVAAHVERLREAGQEWAQVAAEAAHLIPSRHDRVAAQALAHLLEAVGTGEPQEVRDAVVDGFTTVLADRRFDEEVAPSETEVDPVEDEVTPHHEGTTADSHEIHEDEADASHEVEEDSPTEDDADQTRIRRLWDAHADAVAYYQQQLHGPAGEQAREYMAGRGLSHALAEDSPWKVGFAPGDRQGLFTYLSARGYTNDELLAAGLVKRDGPAGLIEDRFKNRVMLPVTDQVGRTIAFVGRKTPQAHEKAPKYLNSPSTEIYDKGATLYGMGQQRPDLVGGARPVIVEGPLDVLAVAGSQGEDGPQLTALATCGTALTAEHVQALADKAAPGAGAVVAFDSDKAGRAAALKAFDLFRDYDGGPVHAADLPEGVDPGDLAGEPERLAELLDERQRLLLDVAVEAAVDARRHRRSVTDPATAKTPYELRKEAAESWGFEPPTPEDVPEPPAPTRAPGAVEEGTLNIESRVALARDLAALLRPEQLHLAGRVLDHLYDLADIRDEGERETLRTTFLDTLLPHVDHETDAWEEVVGKKLAETDPSAQSSAPTQAEVAATPAPKVPAVEPALPAAPVMSSRPIDFRGEVAPVRHEPLPPMTQRDMALRQIMAKYPTIRRDQAEAVAGIVTSGRGVDMIEGPAGSGKSYVVAKLAEVWRERTQTPVVGLALAQNAANVLQNEGLDSAYNIEKWLHRIESGKTRVVPGQLIVVDEYSMVSNHLLAKIQSLATKAHAKIVWAGDHEQLPAPEAGGMGRYLSKVGGAYELTEVARFDAQWERDASLGLREGSPEALREYDKHGRLFAGTRDDVQAQALRSYLADLLAGRNTLLLTSTNEAASELSARVRAELVELGRVEADGLTLADTNAAGVGDLIMARANESTISVGGRERALTNRDVLQVVETREDGSIKAALMGTAEEAPTYAILPPKYVAQHVELAYSGTAHAAQGRTVDTCHGIADETTTRQMWYVLMTRGRYGNYAYAVAERERIADLRTGPEQSEEEVTRQRQAAARERGELRSEVEFIGDEVPQDQPQDAAAQRRQEAEQRQALDQQRLGIFTSVLERDGADQTSIEAMYAEFERSRHSAHLGAMWLDSTRTYQAIAYLERAVQRGTLDRDEADRARGEDEFPVLGRLLNRLEQAGYNADGILDIAITQRGRVELDSAESISRVLHWRINKDAENRDINVDSLEPTEEEIHATQVERTKPLGMPEIDRFRFEVAEAMDDRAEELAQREAERPSAWMVERIGPVPEADDAERQTWIQRARAVVAYREQWMYDATTDAIGPAPSRKEPERRASWLAAHDALGAPEGERDLSTMGVGDLYALRATYARETAWAPAHVAPQLRAASLQARDLADEAAILRARAASVEDPRRRAGLEARAAGRTELAQELREHCRDLAQVDAARGQWYEVTEDKRVVAQRADHELRRRAAEEIKAGRAPSVDVESLPPLHLNADEARQREAERQRRQERAEAERERQCEGQQELGLEIPESARRQEAERVEPAPRETDEAEREQEQEQEPHEVDENQLSLDIKDGELVPGQEWAADWAAQRDRDGVSVDQIALDIQDGDLVPGRTAPADRTAELDRMIDQARQAAEVATHRADIEAERQAEHDDVLQRHREQAHEIDEALLEREHQARQELEEREAERAEIDREDEEIEREGEPEREHEDEEMEL